MVMGNAQEPEGTQEQGGAARGRPPGRTTQGDQTKDRLYTTALRLMAAQGYGSTTLRQIAAEAGVSHALLYRYFPSKGAVVLALYERLSADFVATVALAKGPWRQRAFLATQGSLAALADHRSTLVGAIPVLVSGAEGGLFSEQTRFSLERVRGVFMDAVGAATDAPKPARSKALASLLYLVHLGILLTWLLDRSPGQRATAALVKLFKTGLPLVAAALLLPGAWRLVLRADAIFEEALLGPAVDG